MRVEVTGVGFSYLPDGDEVLRDLDIDVPSGTIHAIVGRSGCGKTTLLRIIAGALTPTAGGVRFSGDRRYLHPTAMVFERPRLIPWWTVERNVGIGTEFTGMPRPMHERIRDFFVSHVGLGGLGDRFPSTLSGGQASRAGLGRALAHDADVLLMDEPLAHLDAPARRRIQVELEAILAIDRRTAILCTHDIEEAVLLGDAVSVLAAGPGPVVDTVNVDAGRPRVTAGTQLPGVRAAVAQVWDALERS